MLKEKFTGLKIGTRLAKIVLELAKKQTKFKIIESGFFAKNKRSHALHKKFGFRLLGVAPKECKLKNGEYCDHVYVYKIIGKL
jgi:RimJ/RimL family protein N-acetyltransferase